MNRLKVSITSYPRRFKMLNRVLESLEYQTYKDFDVVITLYKQECENDLDKLDKIISNSKLNIELNFVDTNTYCHKNTFEVMKLYPDNPILVIDDDIVRVPECVEHFVNDYLYYNCIIARNYDNILKDDNVIYRSCGGLTNSKEKYKIPSGVKFFSGVEMPNTGGHGILYPPHCIKNPRFLDFNLIQQCSPTSTEVWLFYWMKKENTKCLFKWEKSWSNRLDWFQKDMCLNLVNTTEKRNEYFNNCKKMLGDFS